MTQTSPQEGQVHIQLSVGAQGSGVVISVRRPVYACRVLQGRPFVEALALVPRLYSVCAWAQSVAAVRAVEDALGVSAPADYEDMRDLLVLIEQVRDHIWKFCIEWPQLLDVRCDLGLLPELNILFENLLGALNEERRLTGAVGAYENELADCLALIDQWQQAEKIILGIMFKAEVVALDASQLPVECYARSVLEAVHSLSPSYTGGAQLPALQRLDTNALMTVLDAQDADQFVLAPQWDGQAFETGPYARASQLPLVQSLQQTSHSRIYNHCALRVAARIADMLQAMAAVKRKLVGLASSEPVSESASQKTSWSHLLRKQDAKLAESAIAAGQATAVAQTSGLAQVEAGRGRLIHKVSLDRGMIQRYQVVAPTEWNFHPRGLAAQLLSGLTHKDMLNGDAIAHMLIRLADPCVGYELQVNHA